MHVSQCLHVLKNHVFQFFLITTDKTKQILPIFVDIAEETACEKIQRKKTLLELEVVEVFVSLNKRPDFWKSLKLYYIIFHCRTSIITQQENVCLYQKFISRFTQTLIIVPDWFFIFKFCTRRKPGILHLNYLRTCLIQLLLAEHLQS